MNMEERQRKRGKFCCCFETRRFCCSFFIILTILLGILLYFVFPAPPQIDIGDAYIPDDPDSFKVARGNLSSNSTNLSGIFSLEIKIASNVTVYSPSWINVGIRRINLNIELYDAGGMIIPNFEGSGVVENLRFPSRKITEFVFPVAVNYNSTIVQDPVLELLRTKCLASPQQQINGRATIQVDISALSWFGIRPKISQDRSVACPNARSLSLLP